MVALAARDGALPASSFLDVLDAREARALDLAAAACLREYDEEQMVRQAQLIAMTLFPLLAAAQGLDITPPASTSQGVRQFMVGESALRGGMGNAGGTSGGNGDGAFALPMQSVPV
jgi:hypothetical protein